MKTPLKISVLWIISILKVSHISGYPGGAPKSVCNSMLPLHGADSQTSPVPFNISLSSLDVQGGDQVTIELRSPPGRFFKGFMVVVTKPGTNEAHGSFASPGQGAKSLGCFDKPNSGATHVEGNEKSIVKLSWTAPNDEDDVKFQVL